MLSGEQCGLVNKGLQRLWTKPVQMRTDSGSIEPIHYGTLKLTLTMSTVLVLQTLFLNSIFIPGGKKKIFIWQYWGKTNCMNYMKTKQVTSLFYITLKVI